MASETLVRSSRLTREDRARMEIARTAVGPTTAWTLIAIFACFVGTPVLVDWIATERTHGSIPQPWSQIGALPGRAWSRFRELGQSGESNPIASRILAANRVILAGLRAFEDGIVDESVVAGRARPAAQSILSGPLRVGNERVYQGRDGWLFYRSDVDYVIGAPFLAPGELHRRRLAPGEWIEQPQPDPRPAIIDFHRQLEARGIVLVVMPVPVKPELHPEKLSHPEREWPVPVQNPSYRLLLDDLRRERVVVFDVGERLVQDRERGEAYLATDTHWRPETMERTAQLLGEFIESRVTFDSVTGGAYEIEPRTVSNAGDTAVMLDLPSTHPLSRPESVVIHRVLQSDATPWRPSRNAEVLVLGDSFANIYSLASMGWGDSGGLVEHLARVLNRPIDRIVQNDAGAYATRERLRQEIASGSDRLEGKKVVVLQFAARELASGDWRLIDLPAGEPR